MTVRRSASSFIVTLLGLCIAPGLAAQGDATAPSADPAVAPELDPATQAELDALLGGGSLEQVADDGPDLRFYGFMDMSVHRAFVSEELGVIFPRRAVFAVGNINLYAAADLTHGFSSLLEVRFSYLPNGALDKQFQYIDTRTQDYAEWLRPTAWGGIVIERAHLDYSYHAMLNVRMGQFLTPYGIWNVDHGSPTVISVIRPYMIGEQLFPTRQVGIEVFGSNVFGWATLGYHLTLSNGRSAAYQLDFDRNKAVGGRLFLSAHELGDLTFGVSGYGGRASDSPRIALERTPVEIAADDSYRELALAADLRWEWRNLLLQGEAIVSRVDYYDRTRRLVTGYFGNTATGFIPDHLAHGAYGLLGYRLPWAGLFPYFLAQYFSRGYATRETVLSGPNQVNNVGYVAGINVRPIPAVVFKSQFGVAWVPHVDNTTNKFLTFQVAWAF